MSEKKTADQVKVYQSLTAPILLGGVPRQFAILNGTFCAALVLGLQSFYILPICVGLHLAGIVLTKKDPHFFNTMLRHLRQKNYYNV